MDRIGRATVRRRYVLCRIECITSRPPLSTSNAAWTSGLVSACFDLSWLPERSSASTKMMRTRSFRAQFNQSLRSASSGRNAPSSRTATAALPPARTRATCRLPYSNSWSIPSHRTSVSVSEMSRTISLSSKRGVRQRREASPRTERRDEGKVLGCEGRRLKADGSEGGERVADDCEGGFR